MNNVNDVKFKSAIVEETFCTELNTSIELIRMCHVCRCVHLS
jgi:hypothetical protein